MPFAYSYHSNMPPVTKNLIIINLLFFLAKFVGDSRYGFDLADVLGLKIFLASDFRIWQLFTYMFMHANTSHILVNMLGLWMLGRIMENVWGSRRFLFFYMVCGVGAGVIQEIAQYFYFLHQDDIYHWTERGLDIARGLNTWPSTVGASGAIYGLMLAFGMTFPNEYIYLYFLLPIKAKYFMIGAAAIELYSSLASSNDGVAHVAHLGGALFGLLLILHWRNKGNRPFGSGTSGSFKDSVNKFFHRFSRPKRPKMDVYSQNERNSDYEYNARKKEREAEIDKILEKVKKSGYTSLTEEEKRKLFDASQR